MKQKDAFRAAYVIVFFLLLCHFGLILLSFRQPAWLSRHLSQGELFAFTEDREYWADVTDFCVENDTLYVLFDDKSILKVYDAAGNYLRSYAFYFTNGESALYIKDQTVYLQDKNRNFFAFADGEFREAIPYTDYESFLMMKEGALSDEEKRTDRDGGVYTLDGASLYRTEADGGRTLIVARPFPLVYFRGATPWIGQMTLLMALCLIAIIAQRSKTTEHSSLEGELLYGKHQP